MKALWQFEVKYRVNGVELRQLVEAEDEVQAWAMIREKITTKNHWLDHVTVIRQVPLPDNVVNLFLRNCS